MMTSTSRFGLATFTGVKMFNYDRRSLERGNSRIVTGPEKLQAKFTDAQESTE